MQKPDQVKFTNLVLDSKALNKMGNAGMNLVAEADWARVHFEVPTARDAIQHVFDWLKNNCKGQYTTYKYYDAKGYSNYRMVIRFEDKHDAIIFKLQDGHRAWENNSPK